MISSVPLSSYKLIYQVTALPAVLFVGMTPANERFIWDKFYVPPQIEGLPIECRFVLFDDKDQLLEFCSETAHPGTITTILNTVPEIMLSKLK